MAASRLAILKRKLRMVASSKRNPHRPEQGRHHDMVPVGNRDEFGRRANPMYQIRSLTPMRIVATLGLEGARVRARRGVERNPFRSLMINASPHHTAGHPLSAIAQLDRLAAGRDRTFPVLKASRHHGRWQNTSPKRQRGILECAQPVARDIPEGSVASVRPPLALGL